MDYRHKDEQILQVTKESFDFEEADAIYEWALKYFRHNFNTILESAERIRFLLDEWKQNHSEFDQDEKAKKYYEMVRKFCNDVKFHNSWLNRHFEVARHIYEMTLANEWEMILQDRYYEG